MFEELFRRLGVPPEHWIVSMLAGMLLTIYRIFEPEQPVTRRKTVRILISGVVSILLVPGIAVFYFNIQNPFFSAALTGLTSYCFEPILKIGQEKFIKRVSNENN
ncbi:hypothetical protein [Dyadobacter sp. OTU695]|uniref:hypothetical protein n=1 Tax=Dyadobacter sp. OTU695 TaxID=3043860 RepID=UPI00313E4A3D